MSKFISLIPAALLALGSGALAQEVASADGVIVVPLEIVSPFDSGEHAQQFSSGAFYGLSMERNDDGTKYPEFRSEKPIFGSLNVGGGSSSKGRARQIRYAFDESQGSGKGYDRLYLDLNGDRDLSNDATLKPHARPPEGALEENSWFDQQVCFESFNLKCTFGSSGEQSIEVLPRLMIAKNDQEPMPLASFIETRVRKGQIEIDGVIHDVVLGHVFGLGMGFDDPSTQMVLVPRSGDRAGQPIGRELITMARIGETLYSFTASPFGERFIARPYTGAYGVLEFAAGDREIERIAATGEVASEGRVISLGEMAVEGATNRFRLPVGDYAPRYLSLEYGDLNVSLAQNYRFGKSGEAATAAERYGMAIRANATCAIDFSTAPEVRFVTPGEKHRVKRGGQLRVEAGMVDLGLGVMFRGFEDRSKKTTREWVDGEGNTQSFDRYASIDPKVLVQRADGEIIAEGVMPFG